MVASADVTALRVSSQGPCKSVILQPDAVTLYSAATHKHIQDLQHALVANNVLMQAAVVFSPSCIAAVAIGNHANTGSQGAHQHNLQLTLLPCLVTCACSC